MGDVPSHCAVWHRLRERADAYAESFQADAAWSIVFRFYAALHLTQGYLRSKPGKAFDAGSHHDRWSAIKASPELGRRFETPYRDLQDLSESVRYDPGFVPTPSNFDNARRQLATVESIVKPKLENKGFNLETLKPR